MNIDNTYTDCSTGAWPKGGSRLGAGCIPIIPVPSASEKNPPILNFECSDTNICHYLKEQSSLLKLCECRTNRTLTFYNKLS